MGLFFIRQKNVNVSHVLLCPKKPSILKEKFKKYFQTQSFNMKFERTLKENWTQKCLI